WKSKDSTSGSSKGTTSQPKYFGNNVQSKVPEFEVADTDMPHDQGEDLGNDDDEPIKKSASKHEWFTKPTRPQEPTDPDWNVGKTPKKGPTQSWLMTIAASSYINKSLKSFDELMSTPIDFSAYIMNGLKISMLTQETLLGPTLRILKDTRSNFAELEYDFEESYKALSEKLEWENPEGSDYSFDLTKPLPLVKVGNHQKALKNMFPNIWSPVKVSLDRYAEWGISYWRAQRKIFNAYAQGLESTHDVYSTKRILAVTRVDVMKKHGLTNLSGDDVADFAIALKMFTSVTPHQGGTT
nr:hypothetical protein [Tanacetum cinerariifolium]